MDPKFCFISRVHDDDVLRYAASDCLGGATSLEPTTIDRHRPVGLQVREALDVRGRAFHERANVSLHLPPTKKCEFARPARAHARALRSHNAPCLGLAILDYTQTQHGPPPPSLCIVTSHIPPNLRYWHVARALLPAWRVRPLRRRASQRTSAWPIDSRR